MGSPTFAGDLAKAIFDMLSRHFQFGKESLQTFHFSNEGICSWYDFAKTIFELSNIHCRVNPIETKDYPTPAKRPHYSVLNKLKIRQGYMLEISYWKDSLATCLNELQKI